MLMKFLLNMIQRETILKNRKDFEETFMNDKLYSYSIHEVKHRETVKTLATIAFIEPMHSCLIVSTQHKKVQIQTSNPQ